MNWTEPQKAKEGVSYYDHVILETPIGARKIKQFLAEKRTKHSAKPNEIRNRIFQMFPTQNKIELFARENNEGWDVWGNEVESSVAL